VAVTISNGARKAAMVTLLLGEETAGAIFQHLEEDEIERIVREVADLRSVQMEAGEQVLLEFHNMWKGSAYATRGGVDYAQKILTRSIGPEGSRKILDKVIKSFGSTVVFTALSQADPQHLSNFILNEHPQTIALILAHLKTSQSAQLLALLPGELRGDVVTRMAKLDEISPDVIKRISSVIEQRLRTFAGSTQMSYGGVRAVAELMNRVERGLSQSVLDSIEQDAPDLAVSIRNLMFVFEDIASVDDSAIREIIQRADKKTLSIALKGATEEIKDRFFSNMSKRAATMMQEEIDVLGAVRLRDVERSQQEVVAVARKLEEEGLLETGAAAGEAYVV
jgi:flagellar motor switch protein FliG